MSVQSLAGNPMIRQIVASGTPSDRLDTTSTGPPAVRAISTKPPTNSVASSASSCSRRAIAPRVNAGTESIRKSECTGRSR